MQVSFLHWWILAAALIALETLLPGTFMIWFGIAAAAMGVVLIALPGLGWEYQLMAFAILAGLAALGGRLWYRRHPQASDQPLLNQRGRQVVGQVLTLDAPIKDGQGRAKLADTTWKIAGPDLPAGAKVRVVDVDGIVLRVEAV